MPQRKRKQKKKQSGKKGQNRMKPTGKSQPAKPKPEKIEEEKEVIHYDRIGVQMLKEENWTFDGQTNPPTKNPKTLDMYLNGLPAVTTVPYNDVKGRKVKHSQRENDIEMKKLESEEKWASRMQDMREAAYIHKRVRWYAQERIQPGMKLLDVCKLIEEKNHELLGYDPKTPLARSRGFPTGCSINSCAAHYTPNYGDEKKLNKLDVMKIDFGTQINGNIIDCAFTMTFSHAFDNLLKAVKEATTIGIKEAGIDVRLCDIGARIKEVMESYEVKIGRKSYPVKIIENLNGHSIGPWKIHGGKTVPLYDNGDTTRMEENELYAIETFGSIRGKGVVYEEGDCSHYMLNYHKLKNVDESIRKIQKKPPRDLALHIKKMHGTLAFCRRWLDDGGKKQHFRQLKYLVDSKIVEKYPPLCDVRGSYTAQYEHTFFLRPTCKEILSQSFDY